MAKSKKVQYSDGDNIENTLLSAFKSHDSDKQIKNLLKTGQWPFLYHLHPDRQNILNWYKFEKNVNLLEIGAGCGAITGVFLDQLKEVVTIDISQRRLDILKARFKTKKNLKVKLANIVDYKPKQKFDYVTSIGVLEYSAKFIESENPYLDFLKKAKSLLKPNGIFILAIENKFGLKYWAGAPEDHTGRLFDSIEGYPIDEGIRTFGKVELKKLLEKAGFSDIEFYYPYPDYKFPIEIYSDQYLPNIDLNPIITSLFPRFVDNGIKHYNLFDQARVMRELLSNEKADFFANSFLVFTKT